MPDPPVRQSEYRPTEIRSVHPYGFRSDEWGYITGIFKYEGRDCYRIRWPQREPKPDLETIDYWPLDDPSDQREYRCLTRP